MANVLVIDDTEDILVMVKMALERDGHMVRTISHPKELNDQVIKFADLILLDVMLPEEDGFSICRRIRNQTDCPILFLTAKTEEEDVVKGLLLGGDDYITKPFSIVELRARVTAHLRRETRVPTNRIKRGGLIFDLSERAVYAGEKPISLTKSEYSICELLAEHPNSSTVKSRFMKQCMVRMVNRILLPLRNI